MLRGLVGAVVLGGMAWLVGCGRPARLGTTMPAVVSSHTPATEARSGSKELPCAAAARLTTGDQRLHDFGPEKPATIRWVTHTARLTPLDETTVELWAHPGARVYLLAIEHGTACAVLSTHLFDNEHDQDDPLPRPSGKIEDPTRLLVALPAAVLSREPVALREPPLREDARDQERRLYGGPDDVGLGVSLACGPVEILADLPGGVQRLRQVKDGIELRGFTRVPLVWSWDDNACRLRLTRHRDDSESIPEVPADYVRLDLDRARRAQAFLKKGHPLYRVARSNEGVECQAVTLSGSQLAFTSRDAKGRKRRAVIYSGGGRDGALELDGPFIQEFDEAGRKLRGIALGCISVLQLLDETSDALELLPASNVIAYHPQDVTRWFKTEAACQNEARLHPRLRLEPGRRAVAAAQAPRIDFGC